MTRTLPAKALMRQRRLRGPNNERHRPQPLRFHRQHDRKPDHVFDPCDYGDPWAKRTCLWSGGGFVMPPKQRIEPMPGNWTLRFPPSPERGHLRSVTPMGFARAVYAANRSGAASSEFESMTEAAPTEAGAAVELVTKGVAQ